MRAVARRPIVTPAVVLPIVVVAVPVALMFAVPSTVVVDAELPMFTAPELVPVLMFVAKFELLLMLVAAPEIVAPALPVTRPVTPSVPPMVALLVTDSAVPAALSVVAPVKVFAPVPDCVYPPLVVIPVTAAIAPEELTWNKSPEPTVSAAVGVASPTPRRLFVLSQKRFALLCDSTPLVPAKITEPAVGANHVGAPEPPETNAWPAVPADEAAIVLASDQ